MIFLLGKTSANQMKKILIFIYRILLALVISIVNAGDPFTAIYVLAACSAYAVFLLVPVRILLKKVFY
jgi:hypothetical protein